MLGFLSNLRDVKSALSAGMLLLFAGWLLLGHEIARVRPTDDTLAGRVAILVDYIGPVATLAVLPFIAYIIGLTVPLHFVGQWTISRWNRNRKKDHDSQGSALQDFILNQVKRAAEEKPVVELHKELVREVPGYVKNRVLYPVWTLLFAGKLRRRVEGLWGLRLMRRALEDPSVGEEIGKKLERDEVKMLADTVLRRVRQRSTLTAAALAQANSGAYERFDKAQSESDFRAGLCLPLLLLTIVIALQIPLHLLTWKDVPLLAILWIASALAAGISVGQGLVELLQIRHRAVVVFIVCWAAVGAIGTLGIPWAQVGVAIAGCTAVLVLVLWASQKGTEAQTELENAIILGHIDVFELKVLEAYAKSE